MADALDHHRKFFSLTEFSNSNQSRRSDNPPGDFPIPPQFNANPHIKIFFKVGTKSAIWLQSDQNLTHRKTKNPRSKKFRYMGFMKHLTFKIDLHPPGTPKPSKNAFLLQQNWFLEGFGVPGGCKSILNVKCLHKLHIWQNFLDRGFFVFRWVKKSFVRSF